MTKGGQLPIGVCSAIRCVVHVDINHCPVQHSLSLLNAPNMQMDLYISRISLFVFLKYNVESSLGLLCSLCVLKYHISGFMQL